MVQGETDEETNNLKTQQNIKWIIGGPKLDNARRLRGIYFMDSDASGNAV